MFGVGFVAVAIAGSHYVAHLLERQVAVLLAEKTTDSVQSRKTNAEYKQDLKIVSYIAYKEQNTTGHFHILGTIKNNSPSAWTGIEIQAELFNKGQFVDECVGHIKILQPDETDHFKIACGECSEYSPPEHDKIVLKVAAAFPPMN